MKTLKSKYAPLLTFLVNAKKNTNFSYNPTLLQPDFDLKAITKIKGFVKKLTLI